MINKKQIKETGATFTPKVLADFLADRLLLYLKDNNIKVLDPACGDGELLISISEKLSKLNITSEIIGIDQDKNYIEKANERNESCNCVITYKQGDYLDNKNDLFNPTNKELQVVDVIIANPPYVRTQHLGAEKAQKLAKKYNLKGRVDLYYPFMMEMTTNLKEGGLLGVITSNRYLSTKSGESVRKFLKNNYEILEVIDLGDTKLFNAAVLPAIFIGRKNIKSKTASKFAKFQKLYEVHNGFVGKTKNAKSIIDILESKEGEYFNLNSKVFKISNGLINYNNENWTMFSEKETEWIKRIDTNSVNKISDWFKVRVGIKTTADKIFIKKDWNLLGKNKPEEILLKELISQENIERWGTNNSVKLKVLYPHVSIDGKKVAIDLNNFPKAMKYFKENEEALRRRTYVIEGGRNWYEIWVPHHPDYWLKPKLVFPDISQNPRFYFDEGGKIVNGNCYWILAETNEDIEKLLLIQGIANSKLMTKYHDLVFNNKLYSGRRRYFTQFVERYPLPDIKSQASKAIIKLVKKLNNEVDLDKIETLEIKLEQEVANAFKVTNDIYID